MFVVDYVKAFLISILVLVLLIFSFPINSKLYIILFIMLFFVNCVLIRSIRRHDVNVIKSYIKDTIEEVKNDDKKS